MRLTTHKLDKDEQLTILRTVFASEIHTPNAILKRLHQLGYTIVQEHACYECGRNIEEKGEYSYADRVQVWFHPKCRIEYDFWRAGP